MKQFIDIFTMQPINRMAYINTDQRCCVEVDSDLSRSELIEQINILQLRMRLLAKKLGVKNKQNKDNLKKGIKKRIKNHRDSIPNECFEYLRTGAAIHILTNAIALLNTIED